MVGGGDVWSETTDLIFSPHLLQAHFLTDINGTVRVFASKMSCMMSLFLVGYMFINKSMTWNEARGHCATIGLQLVTIHTRAENEKLKQVSGSTGWIGYRSKGREVLS